MLLLGHADTVYPLGTLKTMPWRERGGRLSGPGAFDMKGGIVQALFALRAMLERGPLPCAVTLLLVPDEEIGSPASRALTERLALKSSAVLVLEPAAGAEGACKTVAQGDCPLRASASRASRRTLDSTLSAGPRPSSKLRTKSLPSARSRGPPRGSRSIPE